MTPAVCLDGLHGTLDSLRVSLLDRGFLYGDGVFEVMRAHGPAVDALDAHLTRLETSLGVLGIVLPLTMAALAEEVRATIRRGGWQDSIVRVTITRGVAVSPGLDLGLAAAPTRLVMVTPWMLPPAARYRQGVSLGLVRVPSLDDEDEGAAVDPSSVKSLNYLGPILAQAQARSRGYDEALCVGTRGRVLEAGSANVFVVRAGELVTPAGPGLLPGVTRARVLALARDAGLVCRVTRVNADAVRSADEVFLTSSVRELMPVTSLDGLPVGDGQPGPVTRQLHRLLRATTPWAHAPMPWE